MNLLLEYITSPSLHWPYNLCGNKESRKISFYDYFIESREIGNDFCQ